MAQDLKKKTFSRAMRGYSPEEVDAYIDSLLRRYHAVSNENEDNKKKLVALLQKLRDMSENGKTDGDSPMQVPSVESEEASRRIVEQAQNDARCIVENAEKTAQDIIRSAQTEARNKAVMITAEARQSATDAEAYAKAQYEAAEKLYHEIISFRDKLFSMYSSHIDMVENIASEANTYFDTVSKAGETVAVSGTVGAAAVVEAQTESAEDRAVMADSAVDESSSDPAEEFAETTAETIEPAEETDGFEEAFTDLAEEFAEISRIVGEVDETEEAMSTETDEFVEEPAADSGEEFIDFSDEFVEEPSVGSETEFEAPADDFDSVEALFARKAEELFSSEDETEPDYFGLIEDEEFEEEEPEIRIDWNICHAAKREKESEDFEVFDDAVILEEEAGEEDDFHDLDQLFSGEMDDSDEYSLADEFDIVYSSRSSMDNVREIEKQPLVSPEAPSNPKKHKRF